MGYLGRQPTPSPVTADDIPDNSIDASKIPDTVEADLKSGRKNLIINGGFDVWQRGETGLAAADFTLYSADRWNMVRTSLNKLSVDGVPYAHCIAGDFSDSTYIMQRVENPLRLKGKTLTLSFYMKSDDGLTNGKAMVRTRSQSSHWDVHLSEQFTYSSTKTKYSFTFDINDAISMSESTQYHGLEVFLYGDDSSTNNNGKSFDIYDVQLELGSTATDFEHRSYGEELALCQRYYHKVGGSVSYSPILTACFSAGSDEIAGFVYHPVEMRVVPTFGFNNITNMEFRRDNDTSFSLQSFTPNINSSTTKTALVWFGGQNTVGTGYSGFVRVKYGTTAELSFNAEL